MRLEFVRNFTTKKLAKLATLIIIGFGLFFAGFSVGGSGAESVSTTRTDQNSKSYYISFDNYYYEVPKEKKVDDKLLFGSQFIYNLKQGIKTNTLDDIFNGGAIGVQAMIPLNGDDQAFESYVNKAVKPAAAAAFQGVSEVIFDTRKNDETRTAEVISKKDGAVIRRQYIVNLPQAIAVIVKDDSEEFRNIGKSVGQASLKFPDYEKMKSQVLAQSFMLKDQMFDDMYRLAHEDLRAATTVDKIKALTDKSKEMFNLETRVSGVRLLDNDMSATVHFIDSAKPTNNKTVTLFFRPSAGEWKIIALQLPNGAVTGAASENTR